MRLAVADQGHGCLGAVALELGLMAHPVGALFGNGALGQLVAQLDLELAPVKASLGVEFGDVKFLALFANLVGHLTSREGWGGKNEAEFVDLLQLGLQRLEGYIEKHEAAIFSRALGFSVALRSSPSKRVILSISSIASLTLSELRLQAKGWGSKTSGHAAEHQNATCRMESQLKAYLGLAMQKPALWPGDLQDRAWL